MKVFLLIFINRNETIKLKWYLNKAIQLGITNEIDILFGKLNYTICKMEYLV